MRSVIQEAATIAQAVELGWIKAGKPKDFAVKVFEEPQTKFFGFVTVKKAKIGIFIEDRPQQQRGGDQRQRKHIPHRRRPQMGGGGQHNVRQIPNANTGPTHPETQRKPGEKQHPHQPHEDHDHHDGHDHDHDENE